MLRASDVYAHIRHALGNVPAAEVPSKVIANHAGTDLVSLHDWRAFERHARLNIRANITVSGGTWTESSLTLTKTGAFTDYVWVDGDECQITDGTGAALGFYTIQSRTSANAIVLASSLGAAADALTDMEATINLAASNLPTNFAQIIGKPVHQASYSRVEMVSFGEILDARAGRGSASGWPYLAAIIDAESSQALGGSPVPRIEFYSGSSSNTAAALSIYYRAGWTKIDEDSDKVQIPEWMEPLYLEIAREEALGYEESDAEPIQLRLARIVAGPRFQGAIQRDGSRQTNLGQMRGGAVQRNYSFVGPGPFTVQDPS